ETIAVHDGHLLDADAHLARLAASAAAVLDRALPPDLPTRVSTAAALAGPGRHRLRIVLTPDGAADVTVHPTQPGPPEPVLLTPVLLTGGAGAHKWADRSPLAGAHLVCDADGTVLEATSANVWALLDGRLVTPPADGRLLAGVTRARVLALGSLQGLPLTEAPLTLEQAHAADALLVTSAIRRAAPAALAPQAEPTPHAHALAQALRDHLLPSSRANTLPAGR
ncbi:MAG TPA: aminotransferase class IV, partial [Solirubrobacteraceae bacterium]|nr:aminotransferase class IV [Solirubrobacteraceae bacterium]